MPHLSTRYKSDSFRDLKMGLKFRKGSLERNQGQRVPVI